MTEWTAISGSWRTVNDAVERDVRAEVRRIVERGDGIVTGGALGVDYIATDEAMKADPAAKRLKIILPTPLTTYANHMFRRAEEGVITAEQASALIHQLTGVKLKNPEALVEMDYAACNQESYYARNSKVIEAAGSLAAFQVNDSQGTQDAINKAKERGMAVSHRKYTL